MEAVKPQEEGKPNFSLNLPALTPNTNGCATMTSLWDLIPTDEMITLSKKTLEKRAETPKDTQDSPDSANEGSVTVYKDTNNV